MAQEFPRDTGTDAARFSRKHPGHGMGRRAGKRRFLAKCRSFMIFLFSAWGIELEFL